MDVIRKAETLETGQACISFYHNIMLYWGKSQIVKCEYILRQQISIKSNMYAALCFFGLDLLLKVSLLLLPDLDDRD